MSVENGSTHAAVFRDRSTGLSIFGFLQIAMGCFAGLMVPLMLLSLTVNPQAGAASAGQMAPAVLIYTLVAITMVWLGVGSIRARRWARALTLVLAWMWLAMGVVSLAMMMFWMPNMSDVLAAQGQQLPPQAMAVMYVVMFGTMGCMYVVLPGIFIAFYQRADVKATCEARDPQIRWTDHCPLPVLSLSLLLGFAATSVIWSAGYGFVAPLFGIIVKGVLGALFFLGFSAVCCYLAWANYKMKKNAWWATLAIFILFGLSTIITFARISLIDMYREMEFPEDQMKMMEDMGVLDMNMPLMTSANLAVIVVYLIWVRRYFVTSTTVKSES